MIYNKNSLLLKEDISENSIHAVVCDPPYSLSIFQEKWDKKLPETQIWKNCYDVLKPGGFLLAFGHARLYHKLACLLEECDFIIKDCLCWCYASSYPHSTNPGILFDKADGYNRTTYDNSGNLTEPKTENGNIWNGYGNLLKTAWEPIILAQKPMCGSYVDNLLKYKCGVLNIDACRIPYISGEDKDKMKTFQNFKGSDHGDDRYFSANKDGKKQVNIHPLGRWPANLLWLDPIFADYDHIFMIPKPSKEKKRSYNKHETVKPVELMEHLIKLVTPDPDLTKQDVYVLDPFMGSGTTGVACLKNRREFFGYEIDVDYFKIAKMRLSEKYKVELF